MIGRRDRVKTPMVGNNIPKTHIRASLGADSRALQEKHRRCETRFKTVRNCSRAFAGVARLLPQSRCVKLNTDQEAEAVPRWPKTAQTGFKPRRFKTAPNMSKRFRASELAVAPVANLPPKLDNGPRNPHARIGNGQQCRRETSCHVASSSSPRFRA